MELKDREKEILEFIVEQINKKGYAPTVREICKGTGLKSTATVHGYLTSLKEKGYIEYETGKGRTLKILKRNGLQTADEMFEELGYMKRNESKDEVKYCYNETLMGDSFVHTLLISKISKNFFCIDEIEGHCIGIGIDLLKAINEKCKELRMDLKREWKEIKGYEGKYIISNYGEIISLPRYKQNNSKLQYVEPKEILRYVNKNNGYVYVQLWNDAKFKNIRLHKLVAENFIENVDNKPQINHIDGNKENNRVDNLEWCTCKENIQHAYKNNLKTNTQQIKIKQFDKKHKFIQEFDSLSEASKILNISIGNISQCINGKRKTSNSFIFERVVR